MRTLFVLTADRPYRCQLQQDRSATPHDVEDQPSRKTIDRTKPAEQYVSKIVANAANKHSAKEHEGKTVVVVRQAKKPTTKNNG
jgi:hypothetical protein